MSDQNDNPTLPHQRLFSALFGERPEQASTRPEDQPGDALKRIQTRRAARNGTERQ